MSRKAPAGRGRDGGGSGGNRGRPAGLMTGRRRQLLAAHIALAAAGQRISICRLARECGLYDYRDARRIVADLRRMGAL